VMLAALVGERHPYVATMQFQLGRLELRSGNPAAAESLFLASASTMGALYGSGSAYRARPLLGVGESRLLLGRPQAEAPVREAIAIWSRPPANSKRNVALATNALGRSALISGQPARAERLQRDALAMVSPGASATDSALGVIAADYVFTLRQTGRRATADSLAAVALSILRRMPAESARVRLLADRP
jgi:hypothetical protein